MGTVEIPPQRIAVLSVLTKENMYPGILQLRALALRDRLDATGPRVPSLYEEIRIL